MGTMVAPRFAGLLERPPHPRDDRHEDGEGDEEEQQSPATATVAL
jgi:hypothetical protein